VAVVECFRPLCAVCLCICPFVLFAHFPTKSSPRGRFRPLWGTLAYILNRLCCSSISSFISCLPLVLKQIAWTKSRNRIFALVIISKPLSFSLDIITNPCGAVMQPTVCKINSFKCFWFIVVCVIPKKRAEFASSCRYIELLKITQSELCGNVEKMNLSRNNRNINLS